MMMQKDISKCFGASPLCQIALDILSVGHFIFLDMFLNKIKDVFIMQLL
jgi:hypothetical protein